MQQGIAQAEVRFGIFKVNWVDLVSLDIWSSTSCVAFARLLASGVLPEPLRAWA
jgi:hypothetical protein